jgi:hypothetical protein
MSYQAATYTDISAPNNLWSTLVKLSQLTALHSVRSHSAFCFDTNKPTATVFIFYPEN